MAALDVWNDALANTDFSAIPKTLYDKYLDRYESNILAQNGCSSLDEYLEKENISIDVYNAGAAAYAESNAKNDILLSLLIEKYGISSESDGYEDAKQAFLDEIGMSEDKVIETYGEELFERTILYKMVLKEFEKLCEEQQ